jgi:hypothetical protein
MVDGEILARSGRLQAFDLEEIAQSAHEAAAELAARAAI